MKHSRLEKEKLNNSLPKRVNLILYNYFSYNTTIISEGHFLEMQVFYFIEDISKIIFTDTTSINFY